MENKTDYAACLKHAVNTYSEFIGVFFCVHLCMQTQVLRTLQCVHAEPQENVLSYSSVTKHFQVKVN